MCVNVKTNSCASSIRKQRKSNRYTHEYLTILIQVLRGFSFPNALSSMCGRIVRENHSQEKELYAEKNYANYLRRNKGQGTGRFETKAVNSEALGMAFVRTRPPCRSSY